jgi:hypothetical protein
LSICDFCFQFETGACKLGLKLPKRMSCREFGPTLDRFCSNPSDFVDPRQLVQMATYFGMKGPELKKVVVMAASAQSSKTQVFPPG